MTPITNGLLTPNLLALSGIAFNSRPEPRNLLVTDSTNQFCPKCGIMSGHAALLC
jgi:hypothetical protein